MNLNEFQQLASRTLPELGDQKFFKKTRGYLPTRLYLQDCFRENKAVDLLHAVLGLAGEVGEIVDPIKKAMFYGAPLDEENIKEEAGDLLWYIAGPLCRALGCTLEELAQANVAKLRKRYPEKYTDAAAIVRADKIERIPAEIKESFRVDWGIRLKRDLTSFDRDRIFEKYTDKIVDQDYYFDEDDKAWHPVPELWEPIPEEIK